MRWAVRWSYISVYSQKRLYTINNSYISKQTWQTHHPHVFACLSVRARMRRTQTSALVPSALATEITRSDFAALRIVLKDCQVAIRSDAIRYKKIVPIPLCCSLDPDAGGQHWFEGVMIEGTSLTALGRGHMHQKGGISRRTAPEPLAGG
jgi:hypothetical protein